MQCRRPHSLPAAAFLFPIILCSQVIKIVSLNFDGLCLLSLKSAIDTPAAFPDWNENDASPCRWAGISCANISGPSDERVVGISIGGMGLRGYIPSELGSLFYLRRLNFHGNNFYGAIPDQLFINASSLHSIFLYGNNISGSLPPSLCTPRLVNVDVSGNSLSGPLPKLLANCGQLQRLNLAGNKFSGRIPPGIFPDLADLQHLDLSSNDFDGPIPNDMGELKSLKDTLNLSYNHFTGNIPKTLADLPLTVSFDLRHNNLSGQIPQTGSFANQGPTAFLNNPNLCGFPLQNSCNNITDRSSQVHGTGPRAKNGITPRKRLKPGLIILISAADALGVAFIGLIIIYIYWKRKDSDGCSCTSKGKLGGPDKTGLCIFPCMNEPSSNDSDIEAEKGGGCGGGDGGTGGELVAIDKGFDIEIDELLRASAYVLGKSGSGIIYKVVLGNGLPVVVRRLGEGGEQRYKEFVAEVQAIGKIKHPNVVRLRAYYWASDEKLLVSDFISNGSLASALRGKSNQAAPFGAALSWPARLKIAKGTARGLAYLHECSPRRLVHGDIRPSNLLLDNNLVPHVADFGLARLAAITGTNPSSSGGLVGGALPFLNHLPQPDQVDCYRAPEARAHDARPTQKWDVYSFGVVLLELLTGRSPELSPPTSSTTTAAEALDLVGWVRRGFEEESPLSEMVDPALLREVHAKKEVAAAFCVALACTEANPEARPRMKTVSENLDKIGN